MRGIFLLLGLMLLSMSAGAMDNQLTPQEKKEGWLLLFDGKTLDGWMTSSRTPSRIPVEDGCINPHGAGGYMMVPERIWENFILSCDFKISKGCNSGIFLRTFSLTPLPMKDVGWNGIEVAIDDTTTAGYVDTGAIYDLSKPTKNAMKPVGEWNHIVITSDRNLITVELNGEKVNRIDLDKFTELNKRPDGTPHKFDIAFKDHPRRGFIGLQDHGSNCWYKNIKLRPLPSVPDPSPALAWPVTRAERTDYQETSHYADVAGFLDALVAKGAPLTVQYIGTSTQGRRMPMAILAKPPVIDAADARKHGKMVVYIQANIHAGEVEGKEAALQLLRDLSRDDKDHLLDRMVLLVTPIYNIDGNEKFGDGKRNRSSQDGPDLVGERANGQGLDLNRDCIKAESLEMQAVLRYVYNAWAPEVMMDLHTTNGTRHGYHLTYSPPLNPNTESGILRYTRDELLPTLRQRLRKEHGQELFDYGNAEGRGDQRAWRTFGEEGRYVTNYAGLRNRIAVLSEAASFLPFKTRVESTYWFVEGVLKEAASQAGKIKQLVRDADKRVVAWGKDPAKAAALGVRFEMASRGSESIPLEKPRPSAEIDHRKAPTDMEKVTLPVYDRFQVSKTARFPTAYLIPAAQDKIVALLRQHGIVVEKIREVWRGQAEMFEITERKEAASPFQGHRLNRLEGRFTTTTEEVPSWTYLVRTAQPLGILLFHLLEPESLDGVAAWNFLDDMLTPQSRYPIGKVYTPLRVPTEPVP